jgi:TRAP transporter TAXI family solute receptor
VRHRWLFALAAGLLAALPITSVAQTTLTWTGGAVGGGWDAISTGVAALLHDKADLSIRVIPGGGAQNPVLVERGDAQIGLGLPPLLGAAARGEEPYRGRTLGGVRAIAGNMSVNVLHFYVAADSPFAHMTMEDIFRGRKPIRLAIPKPGTSDVWVLEKMMEFYELCSPGKTADCYRSWESAGAKLVRGSYADQAAAFSSHKADAVFAILALPAAAIVDAASARALTLLPCAEALVAHLTTFGFGRGEIPAGIYPRATNGGESIASAAMGTTIVVSAAVSDEVAYAITKAINDNPDRFRRLHASLSDYDPSKGWLNLGVALHPGAERYYREKGWLGRR